ncbi:EamA family transporter RarD [Aliigemmobacter aestuarii]|uniref:EamA family transporter RarD n=1 Tax=Aliigemmobacter aestuarii TaxID=1445661 RepID=A0A4S3MLN3_9RHOB|nr:EamA family transporter RarD [Gemmobacter aestuarii]THD82925.1 EamA family transporter RarD [Gemmobacter aestuarii]
MTSQNIDTSKGFAYAVTAYVMWGFLPLYMKALAHIPTIEVLAHRVVWSLPVAVAVLWARSRTADLRTALKTPRMLVMGAVTATLIAVNWGIYVWAIQSGQALEAALGYYINPLFSVLLGAVVLRERLSPLQWTAIGLAAAAVAVLTVETGRLPLIALALTLTWGIYAYLKKMLPIGPNQGFTLEVILLLPAALAYMAWVGGDAAFVTGTGWDQVLLLCAGLVTAVPLMIYANGAKLLRLSTIGILQYIVPTMIFLTAVFLFDEPFGHARAIAFPMIWAALALYTVELLRASRRREKPAE